VLRRVAKFFLAFVLGSLVFSFLIFVGTLYVISSGPDVQENSVLWLRLSPNIVEKASNNPLSQLIDPRETIGSVVQSLRKAKVDERIQSVVLIPPAQQGLWGKVQEIREAIKDYKSSGKKIVAFLEYGGNQQYYLATACDEIFLTPTSPLDFTGVARSELFLREAFNKIGIYPDMLHAGDFKTASNLYTETTFTPEHREMSEALNRDLFEQLVAGVAKGRRMSEEDVFQLINEGPFLPKDALSKGLIDGLMYEDEILDFLEADDKGVTPIPHSDYQYVSGSSVGLNEGPAIAIIYAVGPITLGYGTVDVAGGDVVGSQAMVDAIRSARLSDGIKAIILRIDSPGGSAVASDIIWREVALATEDKPVVVSMSDVAASGGYYMAAPADVIVAQPATLTGSIGVFAGKLAFGEVLKKFGIGLETIADGQMSDMNSVGASYSDEARERMQKQIDAIYEEFLNRVSEGRGMTRDEVHSVAQGRVWTGQQALSVGLVDELGGLEHAVLVAKQHAGIDIGQEVERHIYPRARTFSELLSGSFGATIGSFLKTNQNKSSLYKPFVQLESIYLFQNGEPLTLMPFLYRP